MKTFKWLVIFVVVFLSACTVQVDECVDTGERNEVCRDFYERINAQWDECSGSWEPWRDEEMRASFDMFLDYCQHEDYCIDNNDLRDCLDTAMYCTDDGSDIMIGDTCATLFGE